MQLSFLQVAFIFHNFPNFVFIHIGLNLCPQVNTNAQVKLMNIEFGLDGTLTRKIVLKTYPCCQFQLSIWPFSFKISFDNFIIFFFPKNRMMFLASWNWFWNVIWVTKLFLKSSYDHLILYVLFSPTFVLLRDLCKVKLTFDIINLNEYFPRFLTS